MRLIHPALRRADRGFTLTEMLLSVVVLLMLVGAMVFSFSSLQRDAQLDEGVQRVETLMRLARAHAANSGRQVQVVFSQEEEMDPTSESTGSVVRVMWEPEPLTKPGEFVELASASPVAQSINELVVIEPAGAAEPVSSESDDTTETAATTETAPVAEAPDAEAPAAPTAISFYPDGSSDAAEFIVASRNTEDVRRVSLQLTGTTGSVHVQWLNGE